MYSSFIKLRFSAQYPHNLIKIAGIFLILNIVLYHIFFHGDPHLIVQGFVRYKAFIQAVPGSFRNRMGFTGIYHHQIPFDSFKNPAFYIDTQFTLDDTQQFNMLMPVCRRYTALQSFCKMIRYRKIWICLKLFISSSILLAVLVFCHLTYLLFPSCKHYSAAAADPPVRVCVTGCPLVYNIVLIIYNFVNK